MKDSGKHLIFATTLGMVLILDQITKYFLKESNLTILDGIFHITSAKNYGAGFSILQNSRILLIISSVVVIAIMVYYYNQLPSRPYVLVAYSLVFAGALGNLIDRIRLGYVIDFLDFQIWPIFNIADSAITIGVIGLIYYFWKN